MRKAILFAVICLVAFSAAAFDTTATPKRIAILDSPNSDKVEGRSFRLLRDYLTAELEQRGFAVTSVVTTYEQLTAERVAGTDYVVDISAARSGANVASLHSVSEGPSPRDEVLIATLAGNAAADFRLSDARTLRVLGSHTLSGTGDGVVPASVGGSHNVMGAFITKHVFQWSRSREALRAIAQDAATRIVEDIHKQ